jgi:hypothetical protein
VSFRIDRDVGHNHVLRVLVGYALRAPLELDGILLS